MNTLQLLTYSLFSISKINQAKKMPLWKVIIYIIFLSVILTLPIAKQVFSIFYDFEQDSQKIAKQLPNFTIKNNELMTNKKNSGFIYQTNSLIFTFDPDGKRKLDDINDDLIGNTLEVAFLPNRFVVSTPKNDFLDSLFGKHQWLFSYQDVGLNNVTSTKVKNSLNQLTLPFWLKLCIFFISIYPVFINLILNLLLTVFPAIIYSKLRFYQLSFIDCLKIVSYCSTIPIIISCILGFINPSFDNSWLIILISLFLFFPAIRNEPHYSLKS